MKKRIGREEWRLIPSLFFGLIFTAGGFAFLLGIGLPSTFQQDTTVKIIGMLWLALGVFRLSTFYVRLRQQRRLEIERKNSLDD